MIVHSSVTNLKKMPIFDEIEEKTDYFSRFLLKLDMSVPTSHVNNFTSGV